MNDKRLEEDRHNIEVFKIEVWRRAGSKMREVYLFVLNKSFKATCIDLMKK